MIFDERAINELVYGERGDVQKDIHNRARRLKYHAVKQVGKQSGETARRMYVRRSPDRRGYIVGSDSDVALMHHEGTAPHVIEPHRGRVLRFSSRGRMIYAQRVLHPGTRANRYLTDNLRRIV